MKQKGETRLIIYILPKPRRINVLSGKCVNAVLTLQLASASWSEFIKIFNSFFKRFKKNYSTQTTNTYPRKFSGCAVLAFIFFTHSSRTPSTSPLAMIVPTCVAVCVARKQAHRETALYLPLGSGERTWRPPCWRLQVCVNNYSASKCSLLSSLFCKR